MDQQARWLDFLDEFYLGITYWPGSRRRNADALYRRSCRTCVFCRGGPPNGDLDNRATEVMGTPAVAESVQTDGDWVPTELAKAQAEDPELAAICGRRID